MRAQQTLKRNGGRNPSYPPPAAWNTDDGVASDLLDHEVTLKMEVTGSLGSLSDLLL